MKILDLIRNAKTLPDIYYGLHFAPGLAEYRVEGKAPERILINEAAMKSMDPTFAGKPMYVRHVEEVDLPNLQTEADGYVIESFYNKADGKHWAKFIVVSDKGHEAIKRGWKLSNAYQPKGGYGPGGMWHGVDYQKEVLAGEFEHMAFTDDPRYAESIILTPEQFKAYNSEKESELVRLANSNDEGDSMFFRKEAVKNAKDFEGMSVTLPKSKVEKTLAQLVNEADAAHMPEHMANGEHMVMVGEDKMKVNDLVKKHMDMCNELAELKAKHVDGEEHNDAEDGDGEVSMNAEDKEKMEKEAAEKKANEEKMIEEKKANDLKAAKAKADELKRFNDLKGAADKGGSLPEAKVEFSEDQVARGKARYGKVV